MTPENQQSELNTIVGAFKNITERHEDYLNAKSGQLGYM